MFDIAASFAPWPWWGLHAWGIVPITDGEVRRDGAGTYVLSEQVFGIGAHLSWPSPLAPDLGLGIGGFRVRATGQAEAPHIGGEASAWAALPYVRLAAGHRLSGSLGVRMAVLAGYALPKPVIVVGKDDVASLGRPWLSLTVGLTWDAFL